MYAIGTHLRVDCGGYWHHGIYVGADRVVHFTDVRPNKSAATVRIGVMFEFASGKPVEVVPYGRRYGGEDAAARAMSLLGHSNYALLRNNCEHVARWCVTGDFRSLQVEAGLGGAGSAMVTAGGAPVSLAVVGGLGTVAGLSGPGAMSGLATVGGPFGALGGVAALPAATAVATATIVNRTILKDDPHAPHDKREALASGRTGARVGAGIAVGAAVVAVAALGKPGVSGAGISSGLKALGALGGRASMARGLVVLAVGGGALVLLLAALAYYSRKMQPTRSLSAQ